MLLNHLAVHYPCVALILPWTVALILSLMTVLAETVTQKRIMLMLSTLKNKNVSGPFTFIHLQL